MPSLTLDPYVLAVPDLDAGREQIESFTIELLNWSRLRQERWVSIYISERAAECLQDDGCYPMQPAIRAAFRKYGIEHYGVNDVVTIINFLLQRTPSLEERYGVRDFLADPSLTLDPNIPARRQVPRVGALLARCIGIVALVSRYAPALVASHSLATRDSQCVARSLVVSGVILYAEMLPNCAFGDSPFPVQLSERIRVCETFQEFLLSVDPVEIWRTSGTHEHARLSVRLAIFAYANQQDINVAWEGTEAFAIGRDFLGSVDRYGFKHDAPKVTRLLRACCETVLRQNLAAVHALRESEGGNAPQRRRGDDKAWRRDIDHDFHLHYWERPNGGPEFGCIGPHNCFDIPY